MYWGDSATALPSQANKRLKVVKSSDVSITPKSTSPPLEILLRSAYEDERPSHHHRRYFYSELARISYKPLNPISQFPFHRRRKVTHDNGQTIQTTLAVMRAIGTAPNVFESLE